VILVTAGMVALLPAGALASNAVTAEYIVPTADSWAMGITPGPGDSMWFTEQTSNKVGKVTMAGIITEYGVPTSDSYPTGITEGPDGNVWFTENNGVGKVGKMSPAGAVLNEYPTPTANSGPFGIAQGPGGALWFTESFTGKIGRVSTAGAFNEVALPDAACRPIGITTGPDGAMWFCEWNASKIGRLTVAGALTEFPLTAGHNPVDIITGPDGALWFTEDTGSRIGRITTAGAVTEFPTLTAASLPIGLCVGPDGAIWFTEWASGVHKIGRITTQGIMTEYLAPTAANHPNRIVPGPDGRLWYTESANPGTNKIARVSVTQPVWYLAEGSTAWGYSCYVTIENPNASVVHTAVTYNTSAGPVDGGTVTLPARSQATINPADTVGQADFSTRVNCAEGLNIGVDRTMSWNGGTGTQAGQEAHNSVGVNEAATDWFLAEGSSQWGFECWLLIQNPNAGAANCNITYMIEGGAPQVVSHTVPARSRATFNMASEIGAKDASIKVHANVPVIPERAMYRNARREGHDSIGTMSPAQAYFLAEGTTAWGFTTYVLMQNPTSSTARVNLTYMTNSGPVPHPANPVVMPPSSRKTIRVNDYLPDKDFSTRVEADVPIIAERAMYWNSATGEVCHDSIGMSSPHGAFYLPDGQSSEGRETWTLVQNPNSVPVTVEISYLTPTGAGDVVRTETVPANSRKTFNMLDHSGINGRAAIVVRSTTLGRRIMVERAMYWNSRGTGTETIGGFSE
jgi:virginiamycin B lyase